MEVLLHFMYVVAIKDTRAWLGDSLMELCMIGFWNLIVVWLKVGELESSESTGALTCTSCYYLGAFSVYGPCWME
jgi:hypothetical protein